MASTKKLLREEAGVRLFEVGEPKSYGRANGCHHRISTMRQNQPRVLADLAEAKTPSTWRSSPRSWTPSSSR